MNCAILLAAGSGSRMNGVVEDKTLLPIMGEPVIAYSIRAFQDTQAFDTYLIVYRDEVQKKQILKLLSPSFVEKVNLKFVRGGDSRQASVSNALAEVASWELSVQYVAIHDVARPLIAPELIIELLDTAHKHQNAIPATLITDTVKLINESPKSELQSIENLDRSKLRSVQTPQIFDFSLINNCYQQVFESKQIITDDSSALAFSDISIKLVMNAQPNPKLTTKNDLDYILYLLNQNP